MPRGPSVSLRFIQQERSLLAVHITHFLGKQIERITKGIIQVYGFDGWMADIREQQRIADELARLIDAQGKSSHLVLFTRRQ